MTDPIFYTSMGLMTLAATMIVSVVALKGWREWIALKRDELQALTVSGRDDERPTTFSRIEVADLKERVRKLEAIAAGVDL